MSDSPPPRPFLQPSETSLGQHRVPCLALQAEPNLPMRMQDSDAENHMVVDVQPPACCVKLTSPTLSSHAPLPNLAPAYHSHYGILTTVNSYCLSSFVASKWTCIYLHSQEPCPWNRFRSRTWHGNRLDRLANLSLTPELNHLIGNLSPATA
jgi:hypothetical protein